LEAEEQSDRDCGRVEQRVLLVEDDDTVAELVALNLHASGSVEDRVSNVVDALISVRSDAPNAALLDLALPGTSGSAILLG
jgi:DNA-binding response OmpR family regulator